MMKMNEKLVEILVDKIEELEKENKALKNALKEESIYHLDDKGWERIADRLYGVYESWWVEGEAPYPPKWVQEHIFGRGGDE